MPPPSSAQALVDDAGRVVPALHRALACYESADADTRTQMLTELVSQVYETAPLPARRSLLETLLRPMGVLGLVTVAGGIFARLRFGMGPYEAPLRLEDVVLVHTSDVAALVDRLQQASNTALLSLTQVIAASPMLASSAAASVLVVLLFRKSRERRDDDFDA